MVAAFLIKGVVIDFAKDVIVDAGKLMAMESHVNDGVVGPQRQVEIVKMALRANIKKKTGIEVPENIENHPAFTQTVSIIMKAGQDVASSSTAKDVENVIKKAQNEITPLAGQLVSQIKGFDASKVGDFVNTNAGIAFGVVSKAGDSVKKAQSGLGRLVRGFEKRGGQR